MTCKSCGRYIEVEDFPSESFPPDFDGRCYFCYSAGLAPVEDHDAPEDEQEEDGLEDDQGDLSDEEMEVDGAGEEN